MILRLRSGWQFPTLQAAARNLCVVKQGSLRPSKLMAYFAQENE